MNHEFQSLLAKHKLAEEQLASKEILLQNQTSKLLDAQENAYQLQQTVGQLKLQMSELNSELEFTKQVNKMNNNNLANNPDPEAANGEAFNFEKETFITRISSLQNQLKMQQEHEIELRAQNENLQTKVRTIEHDRTRRDDAIFQLQRELQVKDLDIKNLGLIEMSLK